MKCKELSSRLEQLQAKVSKQISMEGNEELMEGGRKGNSKEGSGREKQAGREEMRKVKN